MLQYSDAHFPAKTNTKTTKKYASIHYSFFLKLNPYSKHPKVIDTLLCFAVVFCGNTISINI